MSLRDFDYSQFLIHVKAHFVETVACIVFIVWLLDTAIKDIRPKLKRIWAFFRPSRKPGDNPPLASP